MATNNNVRPSLLRRARTSRGLTLEDVCGATGIDAPMLSRFETGRRTPGPEAVSVLAHFYGVRERTLRGWLPKREAATAAPAQEGAPR